VYAQDEWAAGKNLKLTFGMRFDRTGNPQCVDDCFSRLTAPFTSTSFQKGVGYSVQPVHRYGFEQRLL
jgi:outer membrane receptor protein involved in Fe transport